jgi:Tfp pilus assembly protein PilO
VIDTSSAWQRRTLALALLGAVLVVLWFAVLSPIIERVGTLRDERESGLRAVSRDRALVVQARGIQAALQSVEQSSRWSRFYDTQKPDQATLQLETDLRTLFKSSTTLTSMTAQPASNHGQLTRVSVKVTLSMPIDQLAECLGRLQSHTRLLQIESLTIQAADFQPIETNPVLSIQAQIAGFMLTTKMNRT